MWVSTGVVLDGSDEKERPVSGYNVLVSPAEEGERALLADPAVGGGRISAVLTDLTENEV